jgi:GT2 family glycosyltransferase
VVVPFAGSPEALADSLERLGRLHLEEGDTLVVADNRPGRPAGARRGSYFARNHGARQGSNDWIVFLDADVEPPPGLLDAYFAGSGVAARYAVSVGLMSQARTLERGYAQTANCAVRRSAFEAVGGFEESVRSGGDADLCFRLRDAGWEMEARDGASVVHRSRPTVGSLLRQRARVGAGARWLEERHPGFAAARPLPRVLAGDARQLARAARLIAAGRREDGLMKAMEGLTDAAFHLGWRLGNE